MRKLYWTVAPPFQAGEEQKRSKRADKSCSCLSFPSALAVTESLFLLIEVVLGVWVHFTVVLYVCYQAQEVHVYAT